MNDNEKVAQKYLLMYEGMINKNKALLEETLDVDFLLTHMTGLEQDRSTYINGILDNILNYYSVDHEAIDVEIIDDHLAHFTGKSYVNAAVFGGSKRNWRLQLKGSAIKRDGDWKLLNINASTY